MIGTGPTVAEALRDASRDLAAVGVAEPRRDAQILIGHALGSDRGVVTGYPERHLTGSEAARLSHLVARRRRREPIAHLLGQREFWSLSFRVSGDTLTPRPDSETVIEAVLARASRHGCSRILDLGTGSGCLLLALLSELPGATGVGVDRSIRALAVAAANARSLGLANRAGFVAGDWATALCDLFDIVVANPPYVRRGDIPGLAPEVARYEPPLALDGGPDGLDAYRALVPGLGRLLAPRGFAAIEVGANQARAVAALAEPCLTLAGIVPDLAGIERCLVFAAGKKTLGKDS